MSDPRQTELRQIKWILLGILACLAVIALAMVPDLIPVAVIAGVIYAWTKIASMLWWEISARWRP